MRLSPDSPAGDMNKFSIKKDAFLKKVKESKNNTTNKD